MLRNLFGVVSGRSCWGLEPWDLRPGLSETKRNKPMNATKSEDEDEQRDIESRISRRRKHSTDGFKKEAAHDVTPAKASKLKLAEIWRVPLRRHVWGEEQYELHPAWGELFLDLIIVGAAYRLGNVLKYSYCLDGELAGSFFSSGSGSASGSSSSSSSASSSASGSASESASASSAVEASVRRQLAGGVCVGPALGILYCVGFFQCVMRLWCLDLHYRSRFNGASRVHRLLDIIGYGLLAYAAACISPVHDAIDEFAELGAFVIACCCYQLIFVLRWLEIATLSRDEESRRFSALRLVDDSPAILLWAGAAITAYYNDPRHVAVPILLWLGGSWSDLRTFYRVQRSAFLRWADPQFDELALPKDRTRVPINVEFAIHRFNEFISEHTSTFELAPRGAPPKGALPSCLALRVTQEREGGRC